ncbi:hypothetical protein EDC01DRAFT_410099 [Geopyxis carbonaria]|nr:hypothetical protein EDC01DRAFT_410099 [Geopyxis carbonaria]
MQFSTYLILLAALASMALAAPKADLETRGAKFNTYGDHTGSWSKYPDGSGTYVRSDDGYTYGLFGTRCWTDLFFVERRFEPQNWQRDDTSIDCATTENCQSAVVDSTERCTTWNVAAEVNIGIAMEFLSIGGGITTEFGGSKCVTAQSENRCQWNDQGCHSVWTSDIVLVSDGYVRRRCNRKNDSDYTAWSKDITIRTPEESTRIGCAAKCDDQSYPGPIPLPPTAK